jgi:hypothetical protein
MEISLADNFLTGNDFWGIISIEFLDPPPTWFL